MSLSPQVSSGEPLQRPPQWLTDAHAVLDTAVAVAYGWPSDISDDDALRELLAMNLGKGISQSKKLALEKRNPYFSERHKFYNTERSHQGYRNMGRRPIDTVKKFIQTVRKCTYSYM